MPSSPPHRKPVVVVIAGVTASGKSALALEHAQQHNGVVINADSQQVYAGIPLITAQPTRAEQQAVPHRLYGHISPTQALSAGAWREQAILAIEETLVAGKLPIVTGGTGLYLKTLIEGLSPIPAVPPAYRQQTTQMLAEEGRVAFHAYLATIDPAIAARLKEGDTQRLIRAVEVFLATGKPLSFWQAQPATPAPYHFQTTVLLPDRAVLYERINARFAQMVAHGAVQEVEALLAAHIPDTVPAMKAVGVPELARYIRGEWSLETAIANAQQASRNYAKRQYTWFRNQV
jgi:tRNA dimethylallyltransferase